jgi:colicin import membrane protein
MTSHLGIGKEPKLQKIIITSAVVHILFITLATVPLKTREREYKSYFVNLVGPTEVRRAPQAVKTPKAKAPAKRAARKTPAKAKPALKKRAPVKPKADMSLESEDRVKNEIERLRAISALSKLRQEKEERMARAEEAEEQIAEAIEGIRNKKQISVSRQAGIPGTQTSLDSESYFALVTEHIWSEWIFPDFDATGLETIISIRIGTDGAVLSQDIEKSSGNILFDRSAAKAISKASPLPPPPVEMEIGVRFHL